jgi:hypothetical protein
MKKPKPISSQQFADRIVRHFENCSTDELSLVRMNAHKELYPMAYYHKNRSDWWMEAADMVKELVKELSK